MDAPVPFGGRIYLSCLGVLLLARGADFVSTWIATPNMVLEANPIAKFLRWRWGMVVNVILCFGFAFWPLPAIIVSTTSALIAARNFQSAWMMRAAGEERYRAWVSARLEEIPLTTFLFCLVSQSVLVSLLGVVLVVASGWDLMIPMGIGFGLVGYGFTVLVFTLLALVRGRRRMD